MDVEWAEISYLRGEKCVCTCAFARYLASAFTPMVTWDKTTLAKGGTTYCQMVGRDATTQTLFIKSITEGADLLSI